MMMLCVCLVVIPATQGQGKFIFLLVNEMIKNDSNHFSKSKTYSKELNKSTVN